MCHPALSLQESSVEEMCLAVSCQRCCGTQTAAMPCSLCTSLASLTSLVSPCSKLNPSRALLSLVT